MKITQFPSKITPELAEETGWHIGDGSMNYYNNKKHKGGVYQLRGHIEDDKQHYLIRIKPIFKKLYDIDISLREMPSTRVFGFQIWSNELVKFKESLGLKIGPKLDLIIPSDFLKTDELKIAVLRGIFDTDGCVYLERKNHKLYPRLQITTICKGLAEQMKKIFNELGLRASVNKASSNLRGPRKQAYILVLRGDEMIHKFMKIIKPKNPKHMAKYCFYQKSFKQSKTQNTI
jgi:DNA-binding transcriptional regulator WhiA